MTTTTTSLASTRPAASAGAEPLDVARVRADFPILGVPVHGRPLVYLDNAATMLKPAPVVEALTRHFLYGAANIHRGVHYLSEKATSEFERTRESLKAFLGARDVCEIVFTSGTTAAINLVARSFGESFAAGDEVVITHLEHHANIVPWQMLRERRGIVLKVAPIDDRGDIILPELGKLITSRTKLVAFSAVSNALGTVNPVEDIIRMAHAKGARVLVDAAQAVAHMALDVQRLDADFLTLSSHKLFGPTGVGVLYGKRELLDAMPPVFGGGDMIRSVTFEKTTYAPPPSRFEAGTPDIGGVIAFGVALDYVRELGLARIGAHEDELLAYATPRLADVPGLRLIGTAKRKAPVLSFTLGDIHPHDIGSILDQEGVAVRAGHHCAQPVMARFGVPATARASFAAYNTKADVDALVAALHKVREVFA
jgi:cysteine desulfurase/selenocysteine lyase